MGSERLVILSDPSTFKVMDIHKYFQDFSKFIESNMANDLFSQLNKSSFEKSRVIGHIGLNKFRKFLKIFMYIHDPKSRWVT
jgi:hypothetical protein